MNRDLADRIADDLGKKIAAKLEADLQREMDLARASGLPTAHQLMMMMKIANGVSMAAIMAVLQAAGALGESPDALFDRARGSLDEMIAGNKAIAIAVANLLGQGSVDEAMAEFRRANG